MRFDFRLYGRAVHQHLIDTLATDIAGIPAGPAAHRPGDALGQRHIPGLHQLPPGVRVGGLDYKTAYREGGADRVRELADERVGFFAEDNQWAYTSLGAEYDYSEPFMTDAQRDYVRSVISRATSGKYTTGMEIPGHFFINNHMSMGAEFYTLLLSIEGEEGFDVRAAEQCVPRLMDKLTYDISPDGILYENVKGFIPLYPIYAAGRRGKRLEYPPDIHSFEVGK